MKQEWYTQPNYGECRSNANYLHNDGVHLSTIDMLDLETHFGVKLSEEGRKAALAQRQERARERAERELAFKRRHFSFDYDDLDKSALEKELYEVRFNIHSIRCQRWAMEQRQKNRFTEKRVELLAEMEERLFNYYEREDRLAALLGMPERRRPHSNKRRVE